jgi:ribosomal RNA-processing protein 12
MRNILDTTAAATATAKRLSLISHAVSLTSPTDMYFVPSISSEVIVATKEMNKRTCDGYVLFAVGHKMKAGDASRATVSVTWREHPARLGPRSLNTYNAESRLADTTPYMVPSAVTSLSRLLFGFFKDGLGDD